MRPVLLFVLACSGVCQEQPGFRTDVQLVMVDVQVTEKGTGKILEFLGPQDFVIRDNGQSRPVREFHFETSPLDIVFVLYGQTWLSPKGVNDFRKGLTEALAQMRSVDRAAVLRGDSEARIEATMTGDLEVVRRALLDVDRRALPHIGLSRSGKLYDAVKVATTLFPRPRDRQRRRAVVALTTDIERRSRVELEPLITDLLEADATLNGVVLVGNAGGIRVGGGVPIPGGPRVGTTVGGVPVTGESIRPAIESTGGEMISGDLFREKFPELIGRLRLRYLLGFYADPAGPQGYHTIDVRLSEGAHRRYPSALVRARRGYYAVTTAAVKQAN